MQKLLVDLRERQDPPLNQAEVARRLGVSRVAVSHWELGGRLPEPGHLQALLDLYGATDAERLEAWRLRSLPRDEPAVDVGNANASEDEPLPSEFGDEPAKAAS